MLWAPVSPALYDMQEVPDLGGHWGLSKHTERELDWDPAESPGLQ